MYKKLIIGVLLMAGGVVGYNALSSHGTPPVFIAATSIASTTNTAAAVEPIEAKTSKAVIVVPIATSTTATIAVPPVSNLTITVGSASYPLRINSTETVLAAMQTLSSTTNFTFTGKENPSMGLFVESINGKANANGQYWFLYVNGESASHGVSTQNVSPGDRVEWKYEGGY